MFSYVIGNKQLLVVQDGSFISILQNGGAVELLEEILVHFKLKVLLLHRKVQTLQIVVVALQLEQMLLEITLVLLRDKKLSPDETETIFKFVDGCVSWVIE